HAVAEAWLWSECGQEAGGTVVLRLVTVDGDTLGEASARVDAITDPHAVAVLAVPLAGARAGGSPVVLWEAEWRDAEGSLIDRDVSLASITENLAGLLDLAPAVLDITVQDASAGGRPAVTVQVKHIGGPAAIGLQLCDLRPARSPGWAVIDGDPRPLLPGKERAFDVHWRGDLDGDRVLGVESWNTDSVVLRISD
ncbi:MAG TPA: hypothetical protein VEX88_08820, partial [Glaciibacter sp.]|nr:hypothetical protein [Glaciibacter sp.]